ncbi:hypothetical protein [Trebonia sp.]|uniref:hypothetical protein n=1 Tax=Trebonia sp. TaxID=2767075 RepID=UPI002607C05A|nr:hypothetical protein [Trebonia sp.]
MSSLESAVRQVHRPGPLEFAWHWRWEIGILAVTAGLSAVIAASLGFLWLAAAAGAGLAAVGALLRWPPARKRLVARAWCVITPHRVRAGCVNAWVQTRSGRLPFVLYAVPTECGERVQLWCRAGITGVPGGRPPGLAEPERTEPTPHGWPFTRRVDDAALDDSQESDPAWS